MVPYIIDDAPAKTGFYTPGSHIEIILNDVLYGNACPDYVPAWSFFKEISSKHESYSKERRKNDPTAT